MTIITIYELIRKDLTLFYPQKFDSYVLLIAKLSNEGR